ncbi:RnfH family protein [Pseudomonas sp. OIL-1]|uniref:RnfH family protein n=1 Tax=Pseudomonas sp. OIL-1 TaxID=2706126 RepID=UPI002115013E|nr:RnfH family protein [Pseudomonas sp. OIL-1]
MVDKTIAVEVAYALPQKQKIIGLVVPEGTSALEAARLSRMGEHFPGLDIENSAMGIFGKTVPKPAERQLKAGERVEIYRALIADPKEVRKQRAAKAKEAKAEEAKQG